MSRVSISLFLFSFTNIHPGENEDKVPRVRVDEKNHPYMDVFLMKLDYVQPLTTGVVSYNGDWLTKSRWKSSSKVRDSTTCPLHWSHRVRISIKHIFIVCFCTRQHTLQYWYLVRKMLEDLSPTPGHLTFPLGYGSCLQLRILLFKDK